MHFRTSSVSVKGRSVVQTWHQLYDPPPIKSSAAAARIRVEMDKAISMIEQSVAYQSDSGPHKCAWVSLVNCGGLRLPKSHYQMHVPKPIRPAERLLRRSSTTCLALGSDLKAVLQLIREEFWHCITAGL